MSESLIPKMTSNTAPSGIASASSERNTSYQAWRAFDGKNSSIAESWASSDNSFPTWVQYQFTTPQIVNTYEISNYTGWSPKSWTFEGSNNGTAWTVLDRQSDITGWTVNYEFHKFKFTNETPFTYFRLNVTTVQGGSSYAYVIIPELKIYYTPPPINKILLLQNDNLYFIESKEEKSIVPTMTSATAPSPYVVSSSSANATYPNWHAFNGKLDATNTWRTTTPLGWLKIDLGIPVAIGEYEIHCTSGTASLNSWRMEASNSGDFNGEEVVISTVSGIGSNQWVISEGKKFETSTRNKYRYYRLNITANNGFTSSTLVAMQLFSPKVHNLNQLSNLSDSNFIKYGLNSPVKIDGIFTNKNYILQDTVSENVDGLWTTQINRKPLSIKFN